LVRKTEQSQRFSSPSIPSSDRSWAQTSCAYSIGVEEGFPLPPMTPRPSLASWPVHRDVICNHTGPIGWRMARHMDVPWTAEELPTATIGRDVVFSTTRWIVVLIDSFLPQVMVGPVVVGKSTAWRVRGEIFLAERPPLNFCRRVQFLGDSRRPSPFECTHPLQTVPPSRTR